MNFHEFSNGTIINLDAVEAAKITDEGKVLVHTNNRSVLVDKDEFLKAIKESKSSDGLHTLIRQLIEALNRLTVHIPTSIRMHM